MTVILLSETSISATKDKRQSIMTSAVVRDIKLVCLLGFDKNSVIILPEGGVIDPASPINKTRALKIRFWPHICFTDKMEHSNEGQVFYKLTVEMTGFSDTDKNQIHTLLCIVVTV